MITFFSALLGFLGAAFPEFLKILKDKKDKEHELKLLVLQAEHATALREYDAKIMAGMADAQFYVAEQTRMGTQGANDKVGIKFIDGLNASVRPVLAYGFFFLAAYIKITILHHMQQQGIVDTPWLIWDEEDKGIFAAIISFYFGSRVFDKRRR